MALTLADVAVASTETFEPGFIKIFIEESDLMEMMPFRKINGDSIKVRQEEQLPAAQWRDVNEDYLESTGTWTTKTEELYILGNEMYADNFILQTQATGGDSMDIWSASMKQAARSIAREWNRVVIYGDHQVNPSEFEGLRKRLTGNQVLLAGAGGASLTLSMVDELIDTVIGSNVVLLMNKVMRRKLTTLARAAGSSVQITYQSVNNVGEQIKSYDGVPIYVIEDRGNQNTILGFVEDPGDGTQDTTSIYAVNLSEEEGFHGIYNGNGPFVKIRDLGEDLDSPGHKARGEIFTGLVQAHPRAGARLRGVLAA